MKLEFSQTYPERMGELSGQSNYFIEKIWAGLSVQETECKNCYDKEEEWDNGFWEKNVKDSLFSWKGTYHVEPKLHTIREDKSNQWCAGIDIHFKSNNRNGDLFQFAPVFKCVSVQKISITWQKDRGCMPIIIIDRTLLCLDSMETLATNDGFDSIEDFFAYFNGDFQGKIIHWTDLKY